MSDIKITGLSAHQGFSQVKSGDKNSGKGFDKIMQEAIGRIYQVQDDAEKAVKGLASGGDITQAVIAMEKADMSFQLMIEVRNKLLSAYEEIMRMQI
ncbi:MAG: flagellar hook-basal body complex protein FliE [Nitrospirota bacterium]